jgi:hypothetical protein
MIAVVGAGALALSACGSVGGKAASSVRPATPVNLTVYVNNAKVSVSPQMVGAGPVVFIVTNQANTAQSLAISRLGQSHPVATTAPINPQGTTQVSVNFQPGDYTVGIAQNGGTDASLTEQSSIRSASIHIGKARANSSGALMQP